MVKTKITKDPIQKQRMTINNFISFKSSLLLSGQAVFFYPSMTLAGLDPNDRDSTVYKKHCRDLGYRITMDAALENLELGLDVLVIGPFTKEMQDPFWLENELIRIEASMSDVDVKVLYLFLSDECFYKLRIKERGLATDDWKMENWNSFSQS
jgi:hypothetical protein